jgi:hypothetical protein
LALRLLVHLARVVQEHDAHAHAEAADVHAVAQVGRATSAPPTASPPGAAQVEGRVLRVDRDGLLVDWDGRLGTVRHGCAEVGVVRAGAAAGG